MASHLMAVFLISQKNKCLTDPNHFKDSKMTILHIYGPLHSICTYLSDIIQENSNVFNVINGWQLAKMKKSIPDMSLSWNW